MMPKITTPQASEEAVYAAGSGPNLSEGLVGLEHSAAHDAEDEDGDCEDSGQQTGDGLGELAERDWQVFEGPP